MAEAVLNHAGKGRFEAESAGSRPAARVNPLAIDVLNEAGIEWRGHPPRGLDGLDGERWDLVITVCDHAREACPVFPGQPAQGHWGMPDPAAREGDETDRRAAFTQSLGTLTRRIDLLLALPVEQMERSMLAARVQAIGKVT